MLVVPNHLAVIIDGNRRWAVKHGLEPWKGHWKGVKVVESFLKWCLEAGIPQVSIYALSTENLNRSKKELKELVKVFIYGLKRLLKSNILDKYQIRVNFVGNLKVLPKAMVRLMNLIMKKTKKYTKRVLNFLIAYGSHFELLQTFRKIMKKVLQSGSFRVTTKDIEENLLVKGPVDLVIRTGGFSRLSNFLLWQTAYAEFYVTDTLWPDFSKKEFKKALRWFSKVKRNFGR
jgi:tritrans,polycis-undecaprenyl-diphosphate synthase [geranylgeranyl-diphosphate specific]